MKQVKVPKSFFAKAKREYRSWRQAWWREALQNSLDAGADTIAISMAESHGLLTISFGDNGSGMTLEVLEDVLMAMGGSLKEDGDIGGFGYAKNLLFFSQHAYKIRTGNCLLVGEGGEYRIDVLEEQHAGTKLEVVFDDTGKDGMLSQLRDLIKFGNIGAAIYVNGELVNPDAVTYDYKVPTDLGVLAFSDIPKGSGSHSSSLWVRVNGLPMFMVSVWTETSHFRGVLDLQGDTRELLTSNRDGLKGQWDATLSKIVKELSDERTRLKLDGKMDLLLNPKTEYRMSSENIGEPLKASVEGLESVSRKPFQQSESVFSALAQESVQRASKLEEEVASIASHRYPANFRVVAGDAVDISLSQIVSRMNTKRFGKLAHLWKIVVQFILSTEKAGALGIENEAGSFIYRDKFVHVGFIFDDNLAGLNVEANDCHRILINPSALPDDWDVWDLAAIAAHEVTHLSIKGHSDYFCVLYDAYLRELRKTFKSTQVKKEALVAFRSVDI